MSERREIFPFNPWQEKDQKNGREKKRKSFLRNCRFAKKCKLCRNKKNFKCLIVQKNADHTTSPTRLHESCLALCGGYRPPPGPGPQTTVRAAPPAWRTPSPGWPPPAGCSAPPGRHTPADPPPAEPLRSKPDSQPNSPPPPRCTSPKAWVINTGSALPHRLVLSRGGLFIRKNTNPAGCPVISSCDDRLL